MQLIISDCRFCRSARLTQIETATHEDILPDPLKSYLTSHIIPCFPEFTLGVARQNLSVLLKEYILFFLLKFDILSILGSCVRLGFRRVISHLTYSSSVVVRTHIALSLSHEKLFSLRLLMASCLSCFCSTAV
jgi:hypothetical protein